jgi:hypothetical protein
MAMERLPATNDRAEIETETDDTQRDTVVIVGAGQNTAHMGESIARLAEEHPVHVFEVNPPLIPVSPDRLHLTNTEEGRESSQRLLGSGAVHAVYLSVIPTLRAPMLEDLLEYAAEGKIDFIVAPKPWARDVPEMRIMRAMVRAAEARRKQIDPGYDPKKNPLVYIHEHYKEKGAWHVLREQLNEVTDRLGRLESVTIDIQEARTAEQEGRVAAFQGGALEDLGPHVISLGLDVRSSINTTDRYVMPGFSRTSLERFRYEGSDLPEDIETSFIAKVETTIIDKEYDETHDVAFTWSGGKGLVDKKDATLTFVRLDTDGKPVRSAINVDLRANTLTVPELVEDLFPETEFDDNGYGYVVESGLNGGDPSDSFQGLTEGELVTKWQQALASQGKHKVPRAHRRGTKLQELAKTA